MYARRGPYSPDLYNAHGYYEETRSMSQFRSVATRGLVALPLLAGLAVAQPAFAAHHPVTRHAASTHKTYTVKMEPGKGGYVFYPAKLTIKAGDSVLFQDVNAVPHNIIGLNAASLKVINRASVNAKSYKVTFNKKGTYNYECQVHLPEMVGQITVK